jgi:hypothetical protein
MFFFGFYWGMANIAVWFAYLSAAFKNKVMPGIFSFLWVIVHLFVVIPIAIVMCLGPFFAGFVAESVIRPVSRPCHLSLMTHILMTLQRIYKHGCDGYPVEVVLSGRAYGAARQIVPMATFYYWQDGARTQYYQYSISQEDDDPDVWHFNLRTVTPNITIPTEAYPLVWQMSYNFLNNTITGNCATGPDTPKNGTVPCMNGSFDPDHFFAFSINDTRTNTVTKLRAIDKTYTLKSEHPAYVLRQVQPDNSLGNIFQKTTVTSGKCSSLKVCSARSNGPEMLAPLGLALLAQDSYATACTTPHDSN